MPREKVRSLRRSNTNTPVRGLFNAIIAKVKQAGDFDDAELILDYYRPCAPETDAGREAELNPYKCDFVPIMTFGNNEGIYVDCYLVEKFHGHGMYSFRIGSIKTLGTDRNACKIMGELCGFLIYHARRYIGEQFCGAPDSWNNTEQSKVSKQEQ